MASRYNIGAVGSEKIKSLSVVVQMLVGGWCCAMAGCASSAISFSTAHWVKPPESSYSGRPLVRLGSEIRDSKGTSSRELIEVDFDASADLRRMTSRGSVTIFVHSYICDWGDNHVGVGGPSVYIDPTDVRGPRSDSLSLYRNKEYRGEYAFFVDVRRKDSSGSIPPQQAFDLAIQPEEVCFFVTGHGALLTFYKSSVARVPKAAIRDVFQMDSALR
jgi:hypothetical protein